ncbi:MAG: NACHT domain-containing protein [Candidatus Electronema aureum]|uniref:NACHT domain-containing protein n=1 Tax=Candidatus Electronema aureum TaxID=2005002 RepID=A0A521G1H9_9BACT|nr:MAG: NACHT domain-containing protein [Candidatus Electronema aureum]
MIETLLISWGIKTAWSAFGPVLEDLAQDVAKDSAKSYIGKCFGSVFSSKNEKVLVKATGQAIKELLDLLEYELGLDEDTQREELIQAQRAVSAFLKQPEVTDSITALLQGEQLDPAALAQAWQQVPDAPPLPDDFSWQRISKRFSRKAGEIRDSIPELKAVFAQNVAVKADEALASSIGPQPDFDLDVYAKALEERFGRLNLDCLDTDGASYNAVRLWSVFVPQSVRECEKFQPRHLEQPKGDEERQEQLRPYFEQPLRPVLEVCADQQLQRLVILGDPGSGKSTLLRCLALEWARDEDANRRATAPLPLLIELRAYNQWECSSGKSFIAYLHHAQNWHRLNQNALDALLHRPGRVLLLLDGLDEIFDPQQRELAVNDIFRFSNDYPNARIILTSRVVGYKPERLRDAGFHHFMLQDFDAGQIEEFLKLWHQITFTFSDQEEAERKRQRLAKAVADSRPIKLLAGNPLLLTLMAIINRKEELPRNRARLYEKAAELLLQQWDTEAKLLLDFPSLSEEIDLRAKAAILRKVALEMQTAGSEAANLIQGEKLIKLIEEYLLTELRFPQARKAANALVEQLRQRNFILCFLGGDSYGFVHRTFLEYFCAAEFVDQFKERQTLKIDGLLALYDQHCREDDWQEVLRLICGQIDESFAGKIIEHLTGLVDLEKDQKASLPELLLAVWCLSEVKNLNKIDELTGGKLLLKTIDCFLQNEDTDTGYELYQRIETIGANWPGKSAFHFNGQIPRDKFYQTIWPYFLAIIFQQRQWIEQLCHVNSGDVRSNALRYLATCWPDKDIRQLCRQAVDDEHENVRSNALNLLVAYWPNKEIFQLLKQSISVAGIAASRHGKEYSHFGEIVFRRFPEFDSQYFLNPRQPIPAKHIQKAAEEAGIPPDKIDEAVRSLSAHMGWDITKGSLAGKL